MMKNISKTFFMLTFIFLVVILCISDNKQNQYVHEDYQLKPSEWLYAQRVFPYEKLNPDAYEAVRKQTIEIKEEAARNKNGGNLWQFAGPVNVGGRITDIEMHDTDQQTIYACAASGGIYKSSDQGATWTQIFDNYYTLSIGDMAIAPTDKRILYVGTGEPNGGRGSITYDGYGVFKSTNEGETFTHIGLEDAGGIGKVEVDPNDSDRVYVAAMGNLFSKNPQRGIYRTIDGGITWENILFISDSTGGIDISIHPKNSDTIYASMWERVRYPSHRTYGGNTSGLYRSYDGGDNWEQLTNGLPTSEIGRIGIGISDSNPDIIYTYFMNADRSWNDIYKTNNGGDSWFPTNSNHNGSYWEGKIQVDPVDPNIVWSMCVSMYKTTTGGQSWQTTQGIWVDQHAVYVHKQDHNFVIIGNDGGVYISKDGTTTNSKVMTLPVTQFYTCERNYLEPQQIMGGTQDRGTQRTTTGNIDDWSSIYGGDGFIIRVDPIDDRYIYAASQRGGFGRSVDGGNSFRGARPSNSDPFNWKTPYVLDPTNPKTIYIGSNKVYKSTTRASRWTCISNNLTNGYYPAPNNYGTITTLAVSPVNNNIIYAGTDDGNVWVNPDGNGIQNWEKISEDLPVRWVTCVAADPFDENKAYVTFSGIRFYDYIPHVFRTIDRGKTWSDISGNLPDFPVNNIQIDPDNYGTYYIATDGGAYVTYNEGENWSLLGTGFPNAPVLDLNLHRPTRTLLAATFGRSMWEIELQSASGIEKIIDVFNPLLVYPNPSSSVVNISFEIKSKQKGKLLIYDMTGKILKVIHEGEFYAGSQKFTWDGTHSGNNRVAGMYICRLVTDKSVFARKIQIIE